MTEKSLLARLFCQARRLAKRPGRAAAQHKKLADYLRSHGRRRFGPKFGGGDGGRE